MAHYIDPIIKITLFLHLFTVLVLGQFDTTPENTHVLVGNSVVLQCKTTQSPQFWSEYYTDPAVSYTVSVDDAVQPVYQSELAIQGIYNLQLISAALKHGGTYGCQNSLASGQPHKYAEIIVFGSDPVCPSSISSNIVIANEVITYSCEITYQGKWAPVMEWKNTNNNIIQPNNESSINYVKYSINIVAKQADHGQRYTCTTKFADTLDPPPGNDAAINKPAYSYTYTSDALTVHWYPTNTQILDRSDKPITDRSELYPGDVIKCVTDSNPQPDTYEWRNTTDNNLLGSSQSIIVDLSWFGDMSITCVVRNAMGGNKGVVGADSIIIRITVKTTTITTTTTAEPLTSEPSTVSYIPEECSNTVNAAIVGGVLGCLLTIICLVLGAFLLRVYIPMTNVKGDNGSGDNPQSTTVYQNVDISQEKPYVQLDVNTREEEVNPYRNDYMELRVT